LCYFTEIGKHVFQHITYSASINNNNNNNNYDNVYGAVIMT